MRIGLPRDIIDTGSIQQEVKQRITVSSVTALLSNLLLGLPLVTLVLLGYQHRWMSEDAFISLRVVDQILAGNGPVFNAGERVEAHTNPLWVAILTVFGALGTNIALSAVYLGIAFTAAGLLAGIMGAVLLDQRLSRSDDMNRPVILIPIGAVIFVAVPVGWDFVTSGLESGLGFGWLGVSFWLLARVAMSGSSSPRWQWYASALALGLGPLVRPDFAIFSAGFLLALVFLSFHTSSSGARFREVLLIGASAALLPVSYQIFRMGYYAAMVPNTAFTKEAGESQWERGQIYFNDFVDPYRLWIPIALVLGWLALRLAGAARRNDWTGVVLLVTPVVTASLHALYVVRVGGDFMHGRLLLPALFSLVLPLAAVRLPIALRPHSVVVGVAIGALLVWSYVAATSLRWPHGPGVNEATGIVAERALYVEETEHPNPVTLEDYAESGFHWVARGMDNRERAENGPRALVIQGNEHPLSEDVPDEVRLVVPEGNIGIHGYTAGTSVSLIDRLGLADAIGGRIELEERGRPGHEKRLPMVWVFSRYSAVDPDNVDDPAFASVRAALRCGPLAELVEATTAPLTVGRFLENIWLSWSLHSLRIPPDPLEAEARFCAGSAG